MERRSRLAACPPLECCDCNLPCSPPASVHARKLTPGDSKDPHDLYPSGIHGGMRLQGMPPVSLTRSSARRVAPDDERTAEEAAVGAGEEASQRRRRGARGEKGASATDAAGDGAGEEASQRRRRGGLGEKGASAADAAGDCAAAKNGLAADSSVDTSGDDGGEVLETVQKWAEHFHSLKSFPERTVAITEHLQRTKRQSSNCSEQVLKKISSWFADKAGVTSLSTLPRIQYLKVISEFEIDWSQKIMEQIAFGILISQSKPLMSGMEVKSVDRSHVTFAELSKSWQDTSTVGSNPFDIETGKMCQYLKELRDSYDQKIPAQLVKCFTVVDVARMTSKNRNRQNNAGGRGGTCDSFIRAWRQKLRAYLKTLRGEIFTKHQLHDYTEFQEFVGQKSFVHLTKTVMDLFMQNHVHSGRNNLPSCVLSLSKPRNEYILHLRQMWYTSLNDLKDTQDFKYINFTELPPFTDKHKSLMCKTLTPEMFHKLKDVKSSKGYSLSNVIQAGVLLPDLDIGCTMGQV